MKGEKIKVNLTENTKKGIEKKIMGIIFRILGVSLICIGIAVIITMAIIMIGGYRTSGIAILFFCGIIAIPFGYFIYKEWAVIK